MAFGRAPEKSIARSKQGQKRAQQKIAYNVFLEGSPSRLLLDQLSDKWVALTMAAFGGDGPSLMNDRVGEPRPLRYKELSRQLGRPHDKTLTKTLRFLERNGMVTRTVTPSIPPAVTYELTPLGLSFYNLMYGIKEWAEAHIDEVLANREKYDARVP